MHHRNIFAPLFPFRRIAIVFFNCGQLNRSGSLYYPPGPLPLILFPVGLIQ